MEEPSFLKTEKCPACGAPVIQGHFYPPSLITEEVMVLTMRKYPDLLAAAIQWSKERNSALWIVVKDAVNTGS
jgi:hypothetical protein